MLRNQRTSLQELYNHEGFLSKLNQELIQAIQDMEENMAVNVRTMLQQQGILGVSRLLPAASFLPVQARPLLVTPDPHLRKCSASRRPPLTSWEANLVSWSLLE